MHGIQTVSLTLLLIMGLLLAPLPLHAGKHNEHSPTMDRIITLRNWKLMETFDLRGEEAQRVFSILEKIDARRARLIRKRRQLLTGLRTESRKQTPDDAVLKKNIQEYLDVMRQLGSIQAEELEALKEVFDIRQQARYLLFSQDISREIRMLMHKKRTRQPETR